MLPDDTALELKAHQCRRCDLGSLLCPRGQTSKELCAQVLETSHKTKHANERVAGSCKTSASALKLLLLLPVQLLLPHPRLVLRVHWPQAVWETQATMWRRGEVIQGITLTFASLTSHHIGYRVELKTAEVLSCVRYMRSHRTELCQNGYYANDYMKLEIRELFGI